MSKELLFSSKEFKQLLNISDCELMHRRAAGKLLFIKKGNSFFYYLHDKNILINHPLSKQLLNWYQDKHQLDINNYPIAVESKKSTLLLVEKILIPINKAFGELNITYGFVSAELNRYIQKNSSSGTAPYLDQHSASELNNANSLICNRHGLACDFLVKGYEKNMEEIMSFIVNNLDFDKVYYYGNNRPLHVSIGNNFEKHLQIMNVSDKGRRIPGRKAYGDNAKQLAADLLK